MRPENIRALQPWCLVPSRIRQFRSTSADLRFQVPDIRSPVTRPKLLAPSTQSIADPPRNRPDLERVLSPYPHTPCLYPLSLLYTLRATFACSYPSSAHSA